ncbi:MAG: hypothetical protein ACRC2V_19205, partial [Xenococcaceae cyanobacterium]
MQAAMFTDNTIRSRSTPERRSRSLRPDGAFECLSEAERCARRPVLRHDYRLRQSALEEQSPLATLKPSQNKTRRSIENRSLRL